MAERITPRPSQAREDWRKWREDEDQLYAKFYQDLNNFPNFFNLKSLFSNREKAESLLKRQELGLQYAHPYHLEDVRCRNVVIFLLIVLGRKSDAWNQLESYKNETMKSIIYLTLQASLQWELGFRSESSKTMTQLQDLYRMDDYEYLSAVAESERGYLQVCAGPKGFLGGIDSFKWALDTCPRSDVYLWKFDLALVIRRNFNIFSHSEHSEQKASDLAKTAFDSLQDVVTNCPNAKLQAAGLVELARLVNHLQSFSRVCKAEDKDFIISLTIGVDASALIDQALENKEGKEDYYVLRECGRQFMYKKDYRRAIECLLKSTEKRETSIAYQQLAKTYLCMYLSKLPIKILHGAANEIARNEVHTDVSVQSEDCADVPASPREECCGAPHRHSAELCSLCPLNKCPQGDCPAMTEDVQYQRLCEDFDNSVLWQDDRDMVETGADFRLSTHSGGSVSTRE